MKRSPLSAYGVNDVSPYMPLRSVKYGCSSPIYSTPSSFLCTVDTVSSEFSIGTVYEASFLNPFGSMNEYIGMKMRTSSPFFARAGESEPNTSASPPDLEKGTASLETIRIFILKIIFQGRYKGKEKTPSRRFFWAFAGCFAMYRIVFLNTYAGKERWHGAGACILIIPSPVQGKMGLTEATYSVCIHPRCGLP